MHDWERIQNGMAFPRWRCRNCGAKVGTPEPGPDALIRAPTELRELLSCDELAVLRVMDS